MRNYRKQMINLFHKKINTAEYLELKKDLESLRISFEGLRLDFELITKKLKVKYKISTRDKEEENTEDLLNSIILKEDGTIPNDFKRR